MRKNNGVHVWLFYIVVEILNTHINYEKSNTCTKIKTIYQRPQVRRSAGCNPKRKKSSNTKLKPKTKLGFKSITSKRLQNTRWRFFLWHLVTEVSNPNQNKIYKKLQQHRGFSIQSLTMTTMVVETRRQRYELKNYEEKQWSSRLIVLYCSRNT